MAADPRVLGERAPVVHQMKSMDWVTFAIAGDSESALTNNGQPRGELSWMNWADRVQLTGGYAESGRRTDEILAGMPSAVAADVLVIMAGTNDVNQGRPIAYSMIYMSLIAERAGDARVVVALIPPFNQHPVEAAAYNSALIDLAAVHGWTVVDPWAAVRAPDNTFVTGATYDGAHPVGATAEKVSHVLTWVIRSVAAEKSL